MTKSEVYNYWCWEDPLLSLDEIKNLNRIIYDRYLGLENKEDGAMDDDGNYLKNIEPKVILLKDLPEIQPILQNAIWTTHFKFGHITFPPNDHDTLLFNEYSSAVKGKYGEHTDESMNMVYDTKMTLLINLSESEYEGGDFIVDNQTQHFFREPGTAILFRSYLRHEVTPVTRGDRISLTYFIQGPKFQ